MVILRVKNSDNCKMSLSPPISNYRGVIYFLHVGATSSFKNPFGWDIIGRNVFAMVIMSGVYFLVTLLVQYRRVFFKPRYEKIF